jgi:hypothetical protein
LLLVFFNPSVATLSSVLSPEVLQHRNYKQKLKLCAISVFRCEVDETRALLGCYAASSDNFLPTIRDNI